MKEETVEMLEIWRPVKTGGDAILQDGTQMEEVVIIINGHPIFLKEDWRLERRQLTQKEAEFIHNKNLQSKNNIIN